VIEDLVSTIIPVHNRSSALRDAVESVIAQDWRPIEILVVDDGSTDDTPAVAAQLAEAHPDVVRVLSRANGGPGAARETGRSAARGEFIQHLDSDDVLLPGKFTAQVAALRAQPDAGAAYGITLLRGAHGRLVESPHKGTGRKVDAMFPEFLFSRWWDTSTPLYRRSVTDAAGPWTSLRIEEDWEYDCRVAALGTRLAYVARPVSETREHAADRLSQRAAFEPQRMRDRATSHELILSHAQRAGITVDSPAMKHYSRELFLLARQCGAAGLPVESQRLFKLSREAAGDTRAGGLDYRGYRALAAVVGWHAVGCASVWFDSLRRRTA
jgi:glycosyltransferase involved in cell wall biosynthesis